MSVRILDHIWFTMPDGRAIGIVLTINEIGTLKTRIGIVEPGGRMDSDAMFIANLGSRFPERNAVLFFPQLRKGDTEHPIPKEDLSQDLAAMKIVRTVELMDIMQSVSQCFENWEFLKSLLRKEGFPIPEETDLDGPPGLSEEDRGKLHEKLYGGLQDEIAEFAAAKN